MTTYILQHVHVLNIKGNVEKRHKVVDRFEENEFRDSVPVKL